MPIRIKDLLSKTDGKYLFVDIIMMALLAVNLFLILFDSIFASNLFKDLFQRFTPDFYHLYDTYVHQDFLAIDLRFVAIFVTELVIRWIIAVKNRKYHRWFFYPFIHWYDVLGCIPLGYFRFFRVLRVIGLIVRLQKLGAIDLTQTYLYSKFTKYLGILTEEVSDRVVLHVLNGIQEEIKGGTPVLDKIVNGLILPQRHELVVWLSHNLQEATTTAYHQHIDELRAYLSDKIASAIEQNRELKNLSKIPVFGNMVTNNLEHTVTDMINTVVDECFQDLASPRNREVVSDVAHLVMDTFVDEERDRRLNSMVKEITLESLELIKDQVRIQQWKIREEFLKEEEGNEEREKVAEAEYDAN